MSNLNELKPIHTLNPFGKFCCTIGHLPSSYMLSLSYEEQLLWFCDFLEKTVIPAVNGNAEAVREMQDLFVELKSYVDDYFTNLNVQEEINNKLDTMAQDGTLDNIINQNIFSELNDKIDTIKSNLSGNIETVQQNLDNNIQENNQKFDDIETQFEELPKKYIVAIGDSWTSITNDTSIWKTLIGNAYNYEIKNYAKSGCGFIQGDKTFLAQAEESVNDNSFNHNQIAYVVVIGGVNDIIYAQASTNTLLQKVQELFSYLQENYKCKILFIPNYQYPFNRQLVTWKTIENQINENNLAICCNIVPCHNYEDFTQDKFHLTLSGQKLLASNIVKCLTGGKLTKKPFNISTSANGGLWFHITQYEENGVIHLSIYGDYNNSETEVVNNITLENDLPFKLIDGHNLISNYCEIKEYSPIPFIEFKITGNNNLVVLQRGNSQPSESKNYFHITVEYDASNIQL